MRHLALAVGARPNYVKAWPLLRALEARPGLRVSLVHTGQHMDEALFGELFAQLGLRAPDVQLGHPERGARPTFAEMLADFSGWCAEARPDLALVVGDVDSTAACALGAHYAGVPVAHVEAGLRCGDRGMPEEINRLVTDAVSSLLLASEPSGVENLRREGRGAGEVRLVGNVMIDTLLAKRAEALTAPLPAALAEVTQGPFALLTLHRPANVDSPAALAGWLEAIGQVAAQAPVVWPLHPRTRGALERHGLLARARAVPGLHLLGPLGYLQTVRLQAEARLVLTDSGGLQEESSALGVPCLTLRPSTERPITLEQGTSVLVPDPTDLPAWAARALAGDFPRRPGIGLWDGRAAERAADALLACLG